MTRLLCALLLVACREPIAQDDVTRDQIASYRAQQRQIDIVAKRYDDAITFATPELCISMHRVYNRDLRIFIAQRAELEVELDEVITAHGGPADLACATQAITVELDYHGAVACQEAALADNQAEAARHLVALGTLMEHAATRIDEIEANLAGDAGPTWSLPSRCP